MSMRYHLIINPFTIVPMSATGVKPTICDYVGPVYGLKQLPKNSGEHLFEVIMRRYENRSTIMTSNRPLEEWGKLLGDVPTAGAILDRFLHHAQTIAITGRSYRLKDHATVAGKEDKNKKSKSKPNEPSTAEPAS
jgi:hypothetical protein